MWIHRPVAATKNPQQMPCLNKEVSRGTFQRCDPKISAVRLKSHRAVKLTNLGLWSDIGRRWQDLESKQKQVSRVFPSFLRKCFFFRFGSLGIHRYASRGLNTNQRRKERRPHSLGGIILWRMIWPCFLPMLPVLWWNLPMLSICHHYSSLECCNFHSGNFSWSLKMMPTRNWCSPFQMKGYLGCFFFSNFMAVDMLPLRLVSRGHRGHLNQPFEVATDRPWKPKVPWHRKRRTRHGIGENRRTTDRFGCLGIHPEAFEALGEPKVTQLKSDEHWVIGFCHFYSTVLRVCNYV